jgi:hypothetical protein
VGRGPVDHALCGSTPRAIPVFLMVMVRVTQGTVCGQVPGTPLGILGRPIVRSQRVALPIKGKYKFCRDVRFKINVVCFG